MPALTERAEDIPLLCAHFVKRMTERGGAPYPALAEQAHRLKDLDWPGNVGQLEKAAERYSLGIYELEAPSTQAPRSLTTRLEDVERAIIIEAIRNANGEIGAAVEALQVPRNTFYYRVKRLGIDTRSLRSSGVSQSGPR
jgi:two-component system, NtrC family, C4-dicarboxylate transport response regulator DctD